MSIKKPSGGIRWGLLMIWATILIHLVYSNIKFQATTNLQNKDSNYKHHQKQVGKSEQQQQHQQNQFPAHLEASGSNGGLFGNLIQFAEAGKKKKKEKSEVVVISVNNPQSKGHGGMYPVYIPTCGGHGRRRR